MALQSLKTTLDNVLPAMDFILELLEIGKERFKDDEFMSSCINSA
jgi:aspartate carbamoyltransferase catalytic subunit